MHYCYDDAPRSGSETLTWIKILQRETLLQIKYIIPMNAFQGLFSNLSAMSATAKFFNRYHFLLNTKHFIPFFCWFSSEQNITSQYFKDKLANELLSKKQ